MPGSCDARDRGARALGVIEPRGMASNESGLPGRPLKVLVTAGPTREYVDDIRFFTNGSTGRMGYAIARAFVESGHEVVLVHGPTPVAPPPGARLVPVESALEMRDAVRAAFRDVDALVMTAAVADYRPEARIAGKRKKTDGPWDLRLVRNPDILAELGKGKGDRYLVGFALEAAEGEANARGKLLAKNLDLIVLNAPATVGAESSDFTLLSADGRADRYMSVSKDFLALRLVSRVAEGRLERG